MSTNELLVRGPNVFAGYWGQPGKTAEAIDAEGWLHTGDAPRSERGEVAIRDRMKDILITSGGKNITPSQHREPAEVQPLHLRRGGDRRRPALRHRLVMLDPGQVAQFAQERQVPYTDYASLARAPEVMALVSAEMEPANAQLARVEQVKDFRIIDELLTAEDEELTPTMKLKRKLVVRKYARVDRQDVPG